MADKKKKKIKINTGEFNNNLKESLVVARAADYFLSSSFGLSNVRRW